MKSAALVSRDSDLLGLAKEIPDYVALLAAVVVAGFLGGVVGIWASILWGVGVLAGSSSMGANANIHRAAASLQKANLHRIERTWSARMGSGFAAVMRPGCDLSGAVVSTGGQALGRSPREMRSRLEIAFS